MRRIAPLLPALLVLLLPATASAHRVVSFIGATGSPPSWTEDFVTLTGATTSNGGATTSPANLQFGTWSFGQQNLVVSASGTNWVVVEMAQPGEPLQPVSFTIAARSGVQKVVSETGAQVTVTGAVGSNFVFPSTSDWAGITWFAIHAETGTLQLDDLVIFYCPDPHIITPITVNEGGGVVLTGWGEGVNQVLAWDFDGDGQTNDATGFNPLFSAAALDGPATQPITLEMTADCGLGGVLTQTVTETVQIANVAPGVTGPSGPTSADEGDPLTFTGSFSDPAATDTHTITWAFGDGATATGNLIATHTFGNQGSYTVTLTVQDDDGGVGTGTLAVSIANVAPTIDSLTVPSGNEGSPLQFGSSVTDPGNDTLTYTWTFGDGSAPAGGPAPVHTYSGDGSYPVTLTVSDGTAVATASGTAVVADVLPTITSMVVPASADEGDVLQLSASATDPGADSLTYQWSFGDGSPAAFGPSVSHAWMDEGAYTVTLTVRDQALNAVAATAPVTIANVAPVITGSVLSGGDEGDALPFSITVQEPGNDVLTATWTFGDGATATGLSVTHAYADEGSYPVSVTVVDGDGGSDSTSGTAVIQNVAPSVTALTGSTGGLEAQTLSWTAVVHDPGSADSVTVEWTFGDGSPPAAGTTASHAFGDDGTYTVTATATDDSGASGSASIQVVVSNDGPTITSMSTPGGAETQTLSFTSAAVDPGGDPITFSWSFGDGSPSAPGASVTHAYADDGTYTVTLTVTDSQGAVGSQTAAVAITNVPPTISGVTGPAARDEGQAGTFTVAATDVSAVDAAGLSATWSFGDGTPPQSGFSVAHAFPDDGTFSVTVTVSDGDDAASAGLVTVVANLPPAITSTPPTAAEEGVPLTYQPTVSDPGAEVFAWSVTAPPGVTVQPSSGELQWTPSYTNAMTGPHTITLQVSDGDGGVDTQTFSIDVDFADDDDDGMADTWEALQGLDSGDPSDALGDPDLDGLSNLDEFLGGTSPFTFDGPGAPLPLAPIGDTEVDTPRPTLSWSAALDPQNDPLTYDVEVFEDPAGTVLVASASGLPADPGGADAWTPELDLAENVQHRWRVRAADPLVAGAWSALQPFFVNERNEAAAAPVPVWPVGGELVGTTFPALEWVRTRDPDRDAQTWEVRVYDGEEVVVSGEGLLDAGEGPNARWSLPRALAEDRLYAWTVRSRDEHGLESATAEETFFYSLVDAPPDGVFLLSPEDGASLLSRSPTLVADPGFDIEGDPYDLLFEVDSAPEFDGEHYAGRTAPRGDGETVAWSLADEGIELPENRLVYARVRGVDLDGHASPPDTISFFVRGPNDPPPAPLLLEPAEGAVVGEPLPALVVAAPEDPEGDPVTLEFLLAEDADLARPLAEGTAVPSGGRATWTPAASPEATVYWSARAVDSEGAAGPWATPRSLVPESSLGACAGCEGSLAAGDPGRALLLLPLLAARRRRTTRPLAAADGGTTIPPCADSRSSC